MGVPPAGFTDKLWRLTTALRPRTMDFWLYYAPKNGAGPHQLRVCDRTGYDFARLTWRTCNECRRGHIMKIRVTGEWQRQGYGTRMMLRAMRDLESYTWTTTPQFEDGHRFFPALSTTVGTGFPVAPACTHSVRGGGFARPRLEGRPDTPWPGPPRTTGP
ncbi:GNAT family N-acetyltransferase [Streptomyces sp. NBC_00715]|uniref:GNAT family N-acetyltransferase n=1 Tax=Streptomyces sp. NBC_00715 TaxID=2975811 RepID=UPI00386D3B7B